MPSFLLHFMMPDKHAPRLLGVSVNFGLPFCFPNNQYGLFQYGSSALTNHPLRADEIVYPSDVSVWLTGRKHRYELGCVFCFF